MGQGGDGGGDNWVVFSLSLIPRPARVVGAALGLQRVLQRVTHARALGLHQVPSEWPAHATETDDAYPTAPSEAPRASNLRGTLTWGARSLSGSLGGALELDLDLDRRSLFGQRLLEVACGRQQRHGLHRPVRVQHALDLEHVRSGEVRVGVKTAGEGWSGGRRHEPRFSREARV